MPSILQDVYYLSQQLYKGPHFHDCHQIIFVLKGEVEFYVNDTLLTAKAGDIAIFSRYENHSVRTQSKEYERYVLNIKPDIVNRTSHIYSLLTDRPIGFCNIINVSDYMEEIISIFKLMLREHNNSLKLGDEIKQLLIKQLLITVYRCTTVNFDNTYDNLVIDVKRKFENEYRKTYTLSTIAKEYNISVSSLSHRFQTATGVSVMEYLLFCRMANAKQMLAETNISIGEIVENCGFSNNSNFSRTFKSLIGLSPSDFRKKYKLIR